MQVKKENILLLNILFLGFSSIFVQICFLREFIIVSFGNEIVAGLVLSFWMLLTGLGAWLGRYFPRIGGQTAFILFLLILLAILPLVTVVKLYLWRSSLPYGSMVSLNQLIYAAGIMLLPYCLVSGFLFTAFTSLLRSSRSYAYEAIGSIAGGLLINFILLWMFGTFYSLRILLFINLALVLIFAYKYTRLSVLIVTSVLVIILCIASVSFGFDSYASKQMFPGQRVINHQSTPYGDLTVTTSGEQLNVYENGLLLFSSNNEILSEEEVHFAMLQHPDPQKILLVSGGISMVVGEILKYSPRQVDYVELNPAVTRIGLSFSKLLGDKRVHIFSHDARLFVKTTTSRYDIVLIILPMPATLQLNRYYTLEFFRELKTKLAPGAVISLSLPSTADYVSPENKLLNSSVWNTLKSVFQNVLILPGQKNYFIASDSALTASISSLVTEREIKTLYVNRYYLDDDLIRDRSNFIRDQLIKNTPLNFDLQPVSFFQSLQVWSSFFKVSWWLIGFIAVFVLVFIIMKLNPVSFGLFTGGWTGASLEILILCSVQVIYGYVFSMLSVIILLFMAGLAAGSLSANKFMKGTPVSFFIRIQLVVGLYALGFPFLILFMNYYSLPGILFPVIIGCLTFIIAFLTGLEYSTASLTGKDNIATTTAKNYSADLWGSGIGVFSTTLFLFPWLGLVKTCIILALLNLLSAIILFMRRKKVVSL